MVVRIHLRFGYGRRSETVQKQTALAVASLMTPVALMMCALGFWRLAADLKWAGQFVFTHGLFSHWQVWLAMGVAVQFAAFLLHRYFLPQENSDDAAFS